MKFEKKRIIATFSVMLFAALMFISPQLIYFNKTASIPLGLYLRIPANFIRRGDIVCYLPPQKVKDEIIRLTGEPPKEVYFIKYVGGLENDVYEINDETRMFVVNGEYCGFAHETNHGGLFMPNHLGKHIVGKDEFLPIAPTSRSFDGRYTGTVSLDAIVSRAVPLLIF